MKSIELIKTPSFEAMDNISDLIYKYLKGKVELGIIKTVVSKILLTQGANNFVAKYNEAVSKKDYTAFTEHLNI